MPNVLLTYGWVRSTYSALRNLSKHNIRVFVSDVSRIGMCQFSRYAKKSFVYPNFLSKEKSFVKRVNSICSQENISLILPSHDETEILAKYKDNAESFSSLPVASYEKISNANDKSYTIDFAHTIGIPAPFRFNYTSINQLEKSLPDNKCWVVKLRKSNSAKGVSYAQGKADTVKLVKKCIKNFALQPERYPIVQEMVEGEGWGVSCLYWEGARIAHFTHRRLREKTVTGGTSTLREHHPNPILEEMAFKLLDRMSWHGLAMVEFKWNPDKQRGWFIEINPRLWGSLHLAISAGVEFPWLLYLCSTVGPQEARKCFANAKIRYPWRSRWYLGDVMYALGALKNGKLLESIKALTPGDTDTYDDLFWDDPGVFFGECLHYLSGFIKHRSINPVENGMLG